MLRSLAETGIRSLMVEGGSRIITSFLAARLVDHVLITIAPIFLGGLRSVEHPVGARGAIPRLIDPSFHLVGDDLIVAGDLSTSPD
jgi:riboflavin biosynthesis pyrimidine reductase